MKKINLNYNGLSGQVYVYIKQMILSGEFQAGHKIQEEKVGQLFGVSRTPIREALKKLSEYGLVVLKPRSNAVVATLTREEAVQLAHIRAQLEALSVKLLADIGTTRDFDHLAKLAEECDALIAEENVAGAFEIDSTLHLEIARRTKNVHLYEIIEKLDAKIQLSRLIIKLPIDRLEKFINQHTKIIQALRARDRDLSETLMRHHILHQLSYF
ncbi:MAG: GntR family transcriptional regulator [Desulfofustis sp.]|nr:GntR family transcriptional regulator [Desulfofustis sp.]